MRFAATMMLTLALVCPCVLAPAAHAQPATQSALPLAEELAQLRMRDRFGIPAEELAAWERFAARLQTHPETPEAVQAEAQLGLAIARFYAKDYAQGFAAASDAQSRLSALSQTPPFAGELAAYAALLLVELGRYDDAALQVERAMTFASRSAAIADTIIAHNARANLAFARNDLPGALSDFCKARDLGMAAADPDHPMVVTNAASCAALQYYLETRETLPAIRIARDYASAHLSADHPRMGNIYNTGYAILLRHGRLAEAQELVRRHLALERQLHEGDADDVFDPLTMLARIRERLGAPEDALELFRAAADMAERLRSESQPYAAGTTRANEARVLAQLGRIGEAEQTARRALERIRADVPGDDWHIGSVEVVLADMLGLGGQPGEGLMLVDSGLARLTAKLPPDHSEVLEAQMVRAQLLARMDEHAQAISTARKVAAQFERQMFDLVSGEQEQVALEPVLQSGFSRYLDVALRTRSDEDAVRAGQLLLLSTLSVTNARIAGARAAQEQGIATLFAALEAAQERAAQAELALAEAQEAATDTSAQAATLETARADWRNAERALTTAYPGWASLLRPKVATLAELQAGLEQGEMLVLPLSLADRAVTLAITADGFAAGESAIRRDELAALATSLRDGIAVPQSFQPATAHRLFAHVFPAETRDMLANSRKLLFPASGYLARIPPGMLLTGAQDDAAVDLASAPWLVRSHAIAIVASLDPAGLAGRMPGARRSAFLGIGAPPAFESGQLSGSRQRFRQGLAPLPRAAEELAELAQALQVGTGQLDTGKADLGQPASVQVITGADATERNFRAAAAPGGGILAFATHGLIGGEVPGLSEPALLLAEEAFSDNAWDDGLLTASEIAALSLDADWVILSACNTAAGADGSAAAYSGLATAFAQAGARSMMLSHWRVRDDASAYLSVETVRGAAGGMPRAEALRAAQLALMSDPAIPDAAHPAIWAPFVIVEN